MKELLQRVTLDIKTVNELIERAVGVCLEEMRTDRRSDYDRAIFWELYKRIADEFVYDFARFDRESIPFRWRDRPEIYFSGLWKGYFMNEVNDLIENDKQFADFVDGALANETKHFNFTERIDKIFRRRYRIPEI